MAETLSMKETVERAMKNLPEENTIDEAMERLLVLAKIERGLQDLEEGKTISHEEVKELSKQWLR